MVKPKKQPLNNELGLACDSKSDSENLILSIKKMFDDLKQSLWQEVSELKKSVEFISSKFDTFREELSETKAELKSTQSELRSLLHENELLKLEINEMQQYSRRDNVMVFGIPETNDESVYQIIDKISEVTGGAEYTADISIAHRLPARPGKPKPIVIKFMKRRSRDGWLQCFKNEAKKDADWPGLPLHRINPQLGPSAARFTAGDHLTATTRNILNTTRDAARNKGYRFVWTRDGKIFARRDESSPVIKINSLYDADNL